MSRRSRHTMESPWMFLFALLFVSKSYSQDFGFDDEVDNRIHIMGNRPDRFRFYHSFLSSKNCSDDPLETRERNARVIFTGTVRRLYEDADDLTLSKAQVEVKRVLKGEEIINHMPGVYPESNDIYWPWTQRLVIVAGLGNPRICRSLARRHETRIFMVTEGMYKELKLNSSLIRLTMDNIKGIESAIEGSKFQPPPTEAPNDQCERVFCAFGGRCMVDPVTNNAECRCIETCSAIFSPVCGSDGTSYASECHLRRSSCTDQKRILTAYQGSCNDNVKDPCKDMKCSFGAQCVASYDGLTARCQCPERCDSYGDHIHSKPVCGSDGRDYPNRCEMRRSACAQMMDITVKYEGQCDPCNGYRCDRYHICQLDAKRRPKCECPNNCPNKLEPVCGSDGKTYSSECQLRVEACRSRRKIFIQHQRDCSTGPNPCARLQCGYKEDCLVDRSGEARCICPPSCEPVQRPVCGNDGMTYDNECELHRQACLSKRVVTVSQYGRCTTNNPCLEHRCHHGAICVVEDNKAICQCPSCTQNYDPVCGSNDITYSNECELRATACLTQNRISVAKQGPCRDVCSDFHCENYAVCEDDGYGRPSCVCSTYCQPLDKPVCGTDEVTYTNECQLKVASCQRQQRIEVASEGHCDRCHNVRCKFGSRCENGRCVCPTVCTLGYDPVCASNGRTYNSECRMMMEACNMQVELTVEYSGECDDNNMSGSGDLPDDEDCNEMNCRFGGICEFEINGGTKCNCDFNCNAVRDTVCGSDGNTYGNSCQLRENACKLQQDIRQVASDFCGELLEEPCDGAEPEKDPATGLEYECQKGSQTNCPANSYCHIIDGQRTGRCCKQDEQPIRNCHETEFGCCPDDITAAPGPDQAGCPGECGCNLLGSQGTTCDPVTGQCACKPGVGGQRCDRCEPGYYGLPFIAKGNSGCIPCNCNIYGSLRDDCWQMDGSCMCKPSITGKHCDLCPSGQQIGPDGCTEDGIAPIQPMALIAPEPGGNHQARTCREMSCRFGAVCRMERGRPECKCPKDCQDETNPYRVCGSDGTTYGSRCQMLNFACRLQKHIQVVHPGDCTGSTSRPPNRPRKTTRHIGHSTNSDSTGVTPRAPEYGWLGDMCGSNTDCIARDSYCRNGLCTCLNGLTPNAQKTSCEGRTYTVPSFSGINSYIEMQKINRAYQELTVEMTFKALSDEGILFYAAKSEDGTGDFISLSIREGFLEFRYDLGSGHVVLKSQNPVILNKFHKVKARRFMQEGVLYVDDTYEATGVSLGKLSNLNLKTNTFIGWVPNAPKEVYENIGTAMPFSGCIESLSVTSGDDTHVYDLLVSESADVVRSQAIAECGSNVCSSMPCLNGGSCMSASQDMFMCKCPNGYTGMKCEESGDSQEGELCLDQSFCQNAGTCYLLPGLDGLQYCQCTEHYTGANCEITLAGGSADITIPRFTRTLGEDSYLEIPLTINPAHSMMFEVWFLALNPDGVILYSAQQRNGRQSYSGDYIALNLVRGYLHYTYDLGSGAANITSEHRIALNVWHRVTISRRGKDGEMSINGGDPITGTSEGALRILNIARSVWLGGYPGEYNPNSGVTTGLDGAIQKFIIDGSQVENIYRRSTSQRGVTQYDGAPCFSTNNPCHNGGQCQPNLNTYTCICPDPYTGAACDDMKTESRTVRPVSFSGATNQEYDNEINRRITHQPSNSYEVRFRTSQESGLLLLQHQSSSVKGDYLALALRGGRVEASYNLGTQTPDNPLIITSNVQVDDGQWHTLVFNREERKGNLSVDGEDVVSKMSAAGAKQLDTDGRLWIGGSYTPPRGLPVEYMRGFIGCIESVKIDGQTLDLIMDRKDGGPTQTCL